MKRIIKSSKLCISCGACVIASDGKIQLKEVYNKGMYLPYILDEISDEEANRIKKACPGNGYQIVSMANDLFGNNTKYDYRIGRYQNLYAIKCCSEEIIKKASSGGIMTALPKYLLEKGIVQGIVATKFIYDDGKIYPFTKIYTNSEALLETQGSKYMPVPALQAVEEIIKFNGHVLFIGTPCQIAGLKLLQQDNKVLKEKIKYTVSNFCGGFKDMRELSRFKSIAKMNNEKISYFQYRGDGQPGRLLMISENGKKWERPYTRYSGLTGYMKYYRCRLCVDATAELADISCGDAWLKKYLDIGGNWSLVITRNNELEKHLHQMSSESLINLENTSLAELIESQKTNIISKKERYRGRLNFFKFSGYPLTDFDGGFNSNKKTNILFEAKVYYEQLFKYFLERIGLYMILRKAVKTFQKN